MLTNANLTIYNYWYNPESGKKEYIGTKITGVHWYTDQKTTVTDKGLVSADMYKIRIPDHAGIQDGRRYLEAREYSLLTAKEVLEHWTIDNGDLFVKGLWDDQIEKGSDLTVKHALVGRVDSYSDNRYGCNPHIRIGGAS